MAIENLSERIKIKRKEKGLTQAELAEQLKMSEMTVRRWEAGKTSPRIDEIQELARILGTSFEYLMGVDLNSGKKSLSYLKEQINTKEQSLNTGMLVYVSTTGERFEAPPTAEGIKFLKEMRELSLTKQLAVV